MSESRKLLHHEPGRHDRRSTIMGSRISVTSRTELVAALEAAVAANVCHYVCASNVHTVVDGRQNQALQSATNSSFRSFPDGKPIWWVLKGRGEHAAEHFPGPELFEVMLARGEQTGHSHYFYGGTPEAQSSLIDYIKRKYPKTRIAGYYSPPFRELTKEEDQESLNRIIASQADFIWVGLGAPKQEIWMANHVERLPHGVMVGVGAAFNFLGGTVNRAPQLMRKLGLEWLYRMTQERRLIMRYLKTNSVFLTYLPIEIFRRS